MSLGLIVFRIARGQDPEIPVYRQTGIITEVESPDPGTIEVSFEEMEDKYYQIGLQLDSARDVKHEIRNRTTTGFTLILTLNGEGYDPSLCVLTVDY